MCIDMYYICICELTHSVWLVVHRDIRECGHTNRLEDTKCYNGITSHTKSFAHTVAAGGIDNAFIDSFGSSI